MIEFITFEFMSSQNINIKNKKARFEYEIVDEFIAGIRLLGTEIKSIRESKASIAEAEVTKAEFEQLSQEFKEKTQELEKLIKQNHSIALALSL